MRLIRFYLEVQNAHSDVSYVVACLCHVIEKFRNLGGRSNPDDIFDIDIYMTTLDDDNIGVFFEDVEFIIEENCEVKVNKYLSHCVYYFEWN